MDAERDSSTDRDRIDDPTVSIIVCARNEAANIAHVLEHVRPYADEVLVVDGHSTDGSREIALAHGARVVFDNRKGKGDAVRTGIREASGDILVFIDADCSHNPHDIPALIRPILDGEADHVSASRVTGGSEELHGDLGKLMRRWGSDVITTGINLRYGVGLTDSQNGFRAIRTDVARRLDLREDITTIEQEMVIKTLGLGARMSEVPSRESVRKSGQSCIVVRKVAFRYVFSWLKYLLLNPPPPRARRSPYRRHVNAWPWWAQPVDRVLPTEGGRSDDTTADRVAAIRGRKRAV